jgi:hypothetical protein
MTSPIYKPLYHVALQNKAKYAPYFTWGDSEADFMAYAFLKEYDKEHKTRYVSKFSTIISEMRSYLRILREDFIISDEDRHQREFRQFVRKALWKNAIDKVKAMKEVEQFHSWMLNSVKKASQLEPRN